jgi:D-alanine-D-alanine ligase-like ATP-grasp enzyme
MQKVNEKWDHTINILQSIKEHLQQVTEALHINNGTSKVSEFVHVPFKGSEIYLLHKAFLDSGGASHENYKTLIEKTVPKISNKTQKGFSAESLTKYSDKVDPEARENVKRFLQRMIRNIDSYD